MPQAEPLYLLLLYFYNDFPIPLHNKVNMKELKNKRVHRDNYNLEPVYYSLALLLLDIFLIFHFKVGHSFNLIVN